MGVGTSLLSRTKRTVARFSVTVVSGPDAGLQRESHSGVLTIGTAQGNTVILSDPTVSRHHCRIRGTDKGLSIEDLGSTNGTFAGSIELARGVLSGPGRLRVGNSELDVQLQGTESEAIGQTSSFGPFVGQSVAMRSLFAVLPKIAATDAAVLIEGETGTGKTLLAEAIHDASPRSSAGFVVVDCASMPATLMEGELFGSVRGAYTGARDRIGLFESGSGGTVFLDEIGELAPELQSKLLRVLEKRVVRRLGENVDRPADVRLIAATNRALQTMVNNGDFRADLFYRLNTVSIEIAPLRERPDDIPLLIRHFYRSLADDSAPVTEDELIEELKRSSWPGNARQLRSAVEQALIFGTRKIARATPRQNLSFREAKANAVAEFERGYLTDLLERHGGNLTQAARDAMMDRTYLRSRLRKYGLYRRDG